MCIYIYIFKCTCFIAMFVFAREYPLLDEVDPLEATKSNLPTTTKDQLPSLKLTAKAPDPMG